VAGAADSQPLTSIIVKQNMASTSVGGLFDRMHQSLSYLNKSVPTNISVNVRTEKTPAKPFDSIDRGMRITDSSHFNLNQQSNDSQHD
jgi:hypothetical protein